jgi:hypothetical protein
MKRNMHPLDSITLFGIIKHLLTGYSGNSKFIVHFNTNYILPLALLQVIVYILGNNKSKK